MNASCVLRRTLLSCALGSALALSAPMALAQSTAATLRGQVSVDSTPATDARVTATNTGTGLSRSAQVGANGSYSLAGLPPGTYRVDVTANGQTTSETVTLRVGQTATLDLGVGGVAETGPQQATDMDAVVVTGTRLVETRTSEVATYVSPRQIQALPQASRNFLAFADTVPGMQFLSSADGSESQLRSGAQGANNINVFIDGVGQKNYVTPGGITGQDDSRGNPFPQSAIGEYKVITSNYKAEYDQISSAAVTAVTRSGTNEFEGSMFWDRTSDDWRAATVQEGQRGKSEEVTEQYGATFAGPILRDRLHFFIAYEAKDFVVPRFIAPPDVFDPGVLPPELAAYYGPDDVPFNQDLWFGKLSLQAGDAHLFELSMRYRDEDSISPGANISAPGFATNFRNDETRVDLRYQFSSENWLNDAHITYEEAAYNPSPVNAGPGLRYTIVDPNNPTGNPRLGVLNLGGGPTFQDKGQEGYSFQNDLTFFGWEGHTVKMGVKYKQVDLNAFQQNPPYPQYFFDVNESLTQPYRVEFTAPLAGRQPFVESSNRQFGIYIQDDWDVTDRLTVNLGLRWDYEKTPSYTDYRVNDDLVAALRGWTNIQNTDYDIEDFISTGNNRSSYKGAWQPRLGFSYDLAGDQRHVIFGGAGRAYDRNVFDYVAREYYAGAFTSYTVEFNTPNHPCTPSASCIPFNPALLSPEGIAAYLAANPRLGGEVNLLHNDLKTPYSDQFSLGMRNAVGLGGIDWNTTVTLSHIRSRDGIYFRLGNRWPDGRFHEFPGQTWGNQPWGQAIPGYGSLILGENGIEYELNSLLLSIEKPYTEESPWNLNIAYTYSDAEENRPNASNGETYYFDGARLGGYYLSTGVPKHRLVLSGLYDMPWDMTLSGKLVLASHRPREATNCNDAPSERNCFYDPFEPEGTIGFKQFDMALEKRWDTGTDLGFRVRADVLNVFNWRNWNQFDGWRGAAGEPRNPDFARRSGDEILLPTRTFKLSFGVDW